MADRDPGDALFDSANLCDHFGQGAQANGDSGAASFCYALAAALRGIGEEIARHARAADKENDR